MCEKNIHTVKFMCDLKHCISEDYKDSSNIGM